MAKSVNSKEKIDYPSTLLVKDIWAMMKGRRRTFLFATLLRTISDIAGLYPIYAIAALTNFFVAYHVGDSLVAIWWIVAGYACAVLTRSCTKYTGQFLGYRIGEVVGVDNTLFAVNHLFQLDVAWHEQENAGNKIKRIQNASDAITKIIGMWFDSGVSILVNACAVYVIFISFDWLILVLIIVFLVVYFFLARVLTSKAAASALRVNAEDEQVTGLVFEAVSNIKTVKVMSMREVFVDLITNANQKLVGMISNRIYSYQSRNATLSVLAGMTRVGIIAVIIYGISQGKYQLGFLILFNSYFSSINGCIEDLSSMTQNFVSGKFSIARLKKMLDQPITIDSELNKKAFPQDWQKITFRKVSFSYGDNQVLKNISFELKRGEKVGIVGLSGAGKSTIFKLLLKEREEFTGDILFDGVSIKDISRKAYFHFVSVVLQDTEVFNFSLQDNITITNIDKKNDTKLFKQSLEIAHMTELVKKFPDGLKTIIGEKGVKLSGGERQRLGIARAIFKQPQILLLDEATSHLDLESEEKIRDSLHTFFENVTAVVIAHRLTTIREMDQILVIEGGKLIESGTFEALRKKKGRFSELWEKQGL